MSINNCVFSGRLGQDPELKMTSGNIPYTQFSVATTRPYKDREGERITDWIPCIAWRGTAELICKHFQKGEPIAVIGALEVTRYTDKDGSPRNRYQIRVDSISFPESSRRDGDPVPVVPPERKAKDPASMPLVETDEFREIGEDDDLPF